MKHNIQQTVKCLGTFHEREFTFDIAHAYFKRVSTILNENKYSALAEEFTDAFNAARSGQDDGTQLATIWCPWMI